MPMSREEKEKVLIGFYLDAEVVQHAPLGTENWKDVNNPGFSFSTWDYRLKPEPVAGWFVADSKGTVFAERGLSLDGAKAIKSQWDIACPGEGPNRIIYMVECDPPEGE